MQDNISRRQLLQQLGLIAAGLAAACTPVRVLVNAYPQRFDDDPVLVDRVLSAFVKAGMVRTVESWSMTMSLFGSVGV